MHGNPALRFRVVFEHREVDNPQRAPAVLHQLHVLTDLDTQSADGVVHDFCRISAEEHDVVILGTGALEDAGYCGVVQEFDDGRLQALAALGAFIDLDVGQALRTIATHKRGVLVNLRARQRTGPGYTQRRYPPLRVLRGAGENLEIAVFDEVSYVDQLQRYAQVRFV